MPKGSLNVSLKGADDIFSTEESRQEQQREQVQQIPIGELFPVKNHPFKVLDDESMQRTGESVEQYGVLSPLIARPRPDGDGYEIISGHRRQHTAQLAGLETLPVIVRQMDDDAAVLLMVDSNLQRENILPSERAFAYKMKLETIKNQGARSDLTSPQLAAKFRSDDAVAKDQGIRGDTVRRYIRMGKSMGLPCRTPQIGVLRLSGKRFEPSIRKKRKIVIPTWVYSCCVRHEESRSENCCIVFPQMGVSRMGYGYCNIIYGQIRQKSLIFFVYL